MKLSLQFKHWIFLMLTVCLMSLSVLHPVSADNSKDGTIKTVESFIIKVASNEPNEEGIFEEAGYNVVNAVSVINVSNGLPTSTEVSAIEDNYDLNGNYVDTFIKHEVFFNDFNSGIAKSKSDFVTTRGSIPLNGKTDLNEFIHSGKVFEKKAVSPEEESEIIKIVDESMRNITISEFTEIKGITYNELQKIKESLNEFKISDEFQEIMGLMSSSNCPTINAGVEMCGAFDHYYRHNTANGDFTVQALSNDSKKYHRVHGNLEGDVDRATRLGNFKSNINSYEDYIVAEMESATWPEVAGWFGVLTGLAAIVAGYLSGPLGWVNIVLYYSGALATFAGLTSTIYSTVSRLSLSREAAKYANNARNNIVWMIMQNDMTYNYFYVSGF